MRGVLLVILTVIVAGCASPGTGTPTESAANETVANASSPPLVFEEGWNESAPSEETAAPANESASEGEVGTDGEPGQDGADGEDCGENSTTINVGTGNC